MSYRSALLCALVSFVLLPVPTTANSQPSFYWQHSIQQALGARDAFYGRVDVSRIPSEFRTLWHARRSAQLLEHLTLNTETDSPWYHLLLGLAFAESAPRESAQHFTSALAAAEDSPGETWVLFLEFVEAGQQRWAEDCLDQLYRQALEGGAESVPLISRQLLIAARDLQHTHLMSDFDRLAYQWAARFAPRDPWPLLVRSTSYLPKSPIKAAGGAFEAANLVLKKWDAQARASWHAFTWLRGMLIALVIGSFILCGASAFASLLHPLSELYPISVPVLLRYGLALVAFASLVSFGLPPFLFLLGILLWPHCSGKKRLLLGSCLALLFLLPFSARIQVAANNAFLPGRPLELYSRAVHQGHSPQLERIAIGQLATHGDKYLPNLTAALVKYKGGDLDAALNFAEVARQLRGDDPVVLNTNGIILYAQGERQKAEALFRRCTELFPRYESGFFNLAQCKLAMLESVEAEELITRATEVAGRETAPGNRVTRFLQTNDRIFQGSIPRLRRTMLADYKPADFWRELLPAYGGNWKEVRLLWNNHFVVLPLSLFPLLVIFVITAIGLQSHRSKKNARTSRLFVCALCGMPTCRKCKAGNLCLHCLKASDGTSNPSVKKRIDGGIVRRRVLRQKLTASALTILFPGLGGMYLSETVKLSHLLRILVSAAAYATYSFVATVPQAEPHALTAAIMRAMLLPFVVYHGYFAVQSVREMWALLRNRGGA
jgi:tetratricopeptide (TPR) repeat protein